MLNSNIIMEGLIKVINEKQCQLHDYFFDEP